MIGKLGYGIEATANTGGLLTKDKDGYYSVMLGAINVNSRNGVFYNGNEDIQKLFTSGSVFFDRVQSKLVESEYDHPDYNSIPGTTKEAKDANYMQRLLRIDPNLVCGVFKDITLVPTNNYEPGSKLPMITIKGKIKPQGPFGDRVRGYLDDPTVNTAFSLRCWRRCMGTSCDITIPVTFDFVPIEALPGIAIADKLNSIGLETLQQGNIEITDMSLEDLVAGLETLADSKLENSVKALLNSCTGDNCIINW